MKGCCSAGRYLFLAAALALCCGLASSVGAQGTGVVEGFVRDNQGKPVAHAAVVLKGSAGLQVDRSITDREGHYRFIQVGAGTFYVSVEIGPQQYADSRRIEILTGELDAHRREDIIIDRPLQPTGDSKVSLEPIFRQNVPPEATVAYENALGELDSGSQQAGVESLERAVEIFPEYYDALNRLGMEALRDGNPDKTAQWCRRALAVNRNSAAAHFGLGWALYQSEKLDEAARHLRVSATINPGASETQWYLGMTLLELKKWQEAERALVAFKKLYPRDDRPALHLYLASAYDHLGQYSDAVRSLEAYFRADPEAARTPKLQQLLESLRRKSRG